MSIDSFFEKLGTKVTDSIRVFSASIFLVFTLGMIFGVYFFNYAYRPLLLIVPPVLALFAYYSRNFAVIVLAAALVFVFL